ncbi:MAG: SIMPL domain-containing protein [Muribaculaceae bacterium]|nr:SIMPL domain-containing protein [Muribaculaceae bacterium]
MKTKFIFFITLFLSVFSPDAVASEETLLPFIEVTGSATLNIIPDRITIEIGMEEYYKPRIIGDSTIVKLSEIEKRVRKILHETGIPDQDIMTTEIGNYRKMDNKKGEFLMAKRIAATITDFKLIEEISERLERKGITSLNVIKIDNSDLERYNHEGLKAALAAAREKAEFIADSENLNLLSPQLIMETGPNYFDTPSFSNVSYDNGAGMDNFRRIVRRYVVKVRYSFSCKS